MRIIVDDKIPFLKGVLEPYSEVIYRPGAAIDQALLQGADALIVRTRTRCDASLLAGTSVKAVATATIGTDHLDIPWLEQHGVLWTNAPGCNSGSVKQYIASALAHLELSGVALKGKTLGIIGVGNVGRKVKEVAEAFAMKVLLNDPPRQANEPDFKGVSLTDLLQQSDLITFHVPLTNRGAHPTHHLFNTTTLSLLKKGVILINSSRGEVVQQEALLKAIDQGIIQQAILDVWEHEPHISDSLHERLLAGTPHIAGYSVDGKANGTAAAVQFISRCFHLPLNDWVPKALPDKANKIIKIANTSEDINFLLAKAITQTYNIIEDHNRLKANRLDFEKLRGQYPVRREMSYYNVQVSQPSSALKAALIRLGFNVIS